MSEETESQSPSTTMGSEDTPSARPISAEESMIRKLPDWIESFLESTEDAASPEIFRLWTGIAALAGAAERRLWTLTGQGETYLNLYTLLVAPPATGKGQAIAPVEGLWHNAKGRVNPRLKLAPKSMTKSSMIDAMFAAQKKIPLNRFPRQEAFSTEILEYSSLCVLAEELGVLISTHDLDFLSILTTSYDTGPIYRETRRTGKLDISIFNPSISFLGGTQPAFLANLLPEEAWGMGAMSRMIMIYSGQRMNKELFPDAGSAVSLHRKALRKVLEQDLSQVFDLYGEMLWEEEARTEFARWINSGMDPEPTHSKLQHYNGRRIRHLIKLSMVASLSRGNDLIVTFSDFNRARDWLLQAEFSMPDIFREMSGKSDGQVISELHYFMFQLWVQRNRKPIHESALYNFLSTRTTSDRVERIIKLAERSNVIARLAGTTDQWVPRPKNEHGVE